MRTAFLDCIGCEQRWLDTERIRAFISRNGLTLVTEASEADVLVLITCAVDARSENHAMVTLRHLASVRRKGSRILVGGCLPAISPQKLAGIDVSGTFSPRNLDTLNELLEDVRVPMEQIADEYSTSHAPSPTNFDGACAARVEYEIAKRGFKIRINHGCRLACAFCVIRKATGELQSIPMGDVVAVFQVAVDRLEPTIMLMGGDTGAYGLDIGTDLAVLLDRLLAYDGSHRIFIHDLNVNWLIRGMPAFARVLETRSSHLRTMCIPIQSGSDAVLKRMRRPYKIDDAMCSLRWIRRSAPHIALGTHVMVGFPGETDIDFSRTVDILEDIAFDFVTCFAYSEHPSAPSASLSNKVPDDVKSARLAYLGDVLGERAKLFL